MRVSSFEYGGHRTSDGWHNAAIAQILRGARMRSTMRRIGYLAQGLYAARVPRRTGRLAASARVTTQLGSGNLGAQPDRWVAIVEATQTYSAAVEFGKENTAEEGNPRPAVKTRPTPGSFPARWRGRHTFGGDNRRTRSVVDWLERH
ncbi:hypothetical protein [Nocardia puris]|uniref:Uncharacterized protein n=1 Tax=Nocardia puris TaxID=208602 RepID=A0A366DD60_9NOCA|nr:hypothetical protein [Nocardia puris]RBO87966.1 hypothetical protein DFR74_110222 [Nocardia puris]